MARDCTLPSIQAWMTSGVARITRHRSRISSRSLVGTPPLNATLAVVYLIIFGSIIGFTAYVWLLQRVRPALATSYAYVNPPIAVLFGVWLLDERFTANEVGAMAVILVGVVIVMMSKAKR